MRLIDADKMATDELAAFISAQAKITDAANRDINSIVHAKIQRLIADTPTVEDAVQYVCVRDGGKCDWNSETGKCKNDKNGKTTEAAEPQPDGIQFRTVDDLGRICIPKDIRDKLGIKPGTECAVYATDELISDEIIVISRRDI